MEEKTFTVLFALAVVGSLAFTGAIIYAIIYLLPYAAHALGG